MNGRLFAKRFVAVALLLFGVACLAGEGEVWMKAVVLAACIVGAVLLFRRTRRDREWMEAYRRRELAGQVVADTIAENHEEKPPRDHAKEVAVAATAAHVAAAPVIIVNDLLKMQK